MQSKHTAFRPRRPLFSCVCPSLYNKQFLSLLFSPLRNSVPRYGRISDVARFSASGRSGATDTSERRLFIRCDCMAYAAARAAPKQQSWCKTSPRHDRGIFCRKEKSRGPSKALRNSSCRAPDFFAKHQTPRLVLCRCLKAVRYGAAELLQGSRPRGGCGKGRSFLLLFPWSRR